MRTMKKGKIFLLAAVLVLALAQVAFPALNAVGPVLPDADGNPLTAPWSAGYNGFPQWYRDSLGQNATLSNPPSPLSIPDPVDGANPFSVQVGWGAEAFYWSSEANVVGSGIDALLVLALEAAWAAEEPNPGDQVVFARIRIRVDTPVAGTYTVIHPYGQKTFTGVAAGTRAINDTVDIGIGSPGNFTGALAGGIGPFLRQVGAGVAAGTFGNSNPAPVENGPNGQILRVIGPGGRDIQTATFTTTGEMFAGTPFNVTRATFSRDAGGNAAAEVFANAPAPFTPGTIVRAVIPGQPAVILTRSDRDFFRRVPFTAPFTRNITVRGLTNGASISNFPVILKDVITITTATYTASTQTLRVAAVSSDALATLSARGWVGAGTGQPITNGGPGVTTFTGVPIPPVIVRVTSSSGGASNVDTVILP